MFDYTYAAFQKIIKDLKSISILFNAFVMIAYLGYLSYAIVANTGNIYLNAFLATISLVYLVFYIIGQFNQISKNEQEAAKHLYTILKLEANALSLLIAIYGITTNVQSESNIIITIALGALWIVQLIVEILVIIIEDRFQLFVTGLMHDAGPFIRFVVPSKDLPSPRKDDPYLERLKDIVTSNKLDKKQKKIANKRSKISAIKNKAKSILHKK